MTLSACSYIYFIPFFISPGLLCTRRLFFSRVYRAWMMQRRPQGRPCTKVHSQLHIPSRRLSFLLFLHATPNLYSLYNSPSSRHRTRMGLASRHDLLYLPIFHGAGPPPTKARPFLEHDDVLEVTRELKSTSPPGKLPAFSNIGTSLLARAVVNANKMWKEAREGGAGNDRGRSGNW